MQPGLADSSTTAYALTRPPAGSKQDVRQVGRCGCGRDQQKPSGVFLISHQAVLEPRVKMRRVARFQPVLFMLEDEIEPSLEDIKPFFTFMMIKLFEISARRQRNLEGLQIHQTRAA